VHQSSGGVGVEERARWLAELAQAIDDAQRLAWRIGFVDGSNPEAMELYARLELARVEVESLRRSGWASKGSGLSPEWIEFLPKLGRPEPFPTD
jgi:hypothetical protein